MTGTQKMGSKKLQVKKWHLTKNDWDQKIGSKEAKNEKWHLKKYTGTQNAKNP